MVYFLMVCQHHESPDIDQKRDENRPRHREWVSSGGNGVVTVLTGSALWDENKSGIGNFGILEADSEADARAFAEGDPFAKSGIVKAISLTRLADGFKAERIKPLSTTY